MRNILFSLIFLTLTAVALPIHAESAGRPYRTLRTQEGLVFFVLPQQMPRTPQSTACGAMEYDWTLTTLSDSVSWTVTVRTKEPLQTDSVCVETGSGTMRQCPLQHIFADKKGSTFVYRLRFYLTRAELERLLEMPTAPLFRFGYSATFSYTEKQWQKRRKTMAEYLHLFDLNK